ncbi:hypothetical protein [Capnocytophaga canis]|uniref:hypothetical protein n=1 Tax=Capnocytophaga canis TaxID=1848903 RepID=UPI001561E380|nr:hypothetical protein [Capnocytophaga canis]
MKNIQSLGIALSLFLTAIGFILKIGHYSFSIGNAFLVIGVILFWYCIYKLLFKRT